MCGRCELAGIYGHPEGSPTPFKATLSGANDIHIKLDDGTIDMDGLFTRQYYAKVPGWLMLSMRGGSADGLVVPFQRYEE